MKCLTPGAVPNNSESSFPKWLSFIRNPPYRMVTARRHSVRVECSAPVEKHSRSKGGLGFKCCSVSPGCAT